MLSLTYDPTPAIAGRTYYSDSGLGQWRKPTGVYLPPGLDLDKGQIDMVLYLHGWYVKNIQQLFNSDPAWIRNAVLGSNKNVALVAPYLGRGEQGGGTYSVRDLTGNWGEFYINDVLNALVPPTIPKPDLFRTQVGLIPRLRLRKLIIACHSGGGAGMRNLVNALGRYKANLAECWGFDCLYGVKASPDDANFWYEWSTSKYGRPLYISFGPSTVFESVKLYLMKKGLATGDGARRNIDVAEQSRIDVQIGISTSRSLDDIIDLPKLLAATKPKPGSPQSRDGSFVYKAAETVAVKAGWPPQNERMALHYGIASGGLEDKLADAGYL
jgi:hypothetical protein